MKKILIALWLVTICIGASVNAETYCDDFCNYYRDNFCFRNSNSLYIKFLGGANFLQSHKNKGIKTDYNTGYIVSGTLGYNWCYGMRTEFEYAFRRNSLRRIHSLGSSFKLSGHFQSSSYMANILWDLPLKVWGCNFWNIEPFVGTGIGYDIQKIRTSSSGLTFKQNKKQFAWQVIAGLAYPLFSIIDISVDYKYHKGGFKHINSQSVGTGLTYTF